MPENQNKLPVWKMVRQAMDALAPRTTRKQLTEWILERWPDTKTNTIASQVTVCTVNVPSRCLYQCNKKPRMATQRYDFLFRPGPGLLEKYEPENHGLWSIVKDADGESKVQLETESDMRWPPRGKLYQQFLEQAEEHGLASVVFPMYWQGQKDKKIEATFIENTLRVVVTPAMINDLDSISESDFSRLDEKYQRRHKEQSQRLRDSIGQSVTLNAYAAAIPAVLEAPKKKSTALNVYRYFHVLPEELKPYITEEQLQTLESRNQARDAMLPFRNLVNILHPSEKYPAPDSQAHKPPIDPQPESIWEHNRNVIFFGPPGTGKSRMVKRIVSSHLSAPDSNVLRVTFHPEYSYFDLVGSFRPVVGWLKTGQSFKDADGQNRDFEPRTYYRFEPGPLSHALKLAAAKANESVVLIIEEINRGNCAGIFGDVFQLLDRVRSNENTNRIGWSEYGIHPNSEWCSWLESAIPTESGVYDRERRVLKLPRNLYLYATMNTSDQSLFPMDTAFRRRWGLKYVGITSNHHQNAKVRLHSKDSTGAPWTTLMHALNREIVQYTQTDDKQMGPWFVRKRVGSNFVDSVEFTSKVLFYLWADVFRDETSLVFHAELNTYEEVLARYDAGKNVFASSLLKRLKVSEPDDNETEDDAETEDHEADSE